MDTTARDSTCGQSFSKRSLRARLRLNILGYGYGQLVTLAYQLVTVPFFLKFWGTERYGDWLVLSGIPMFLTFADLGVAQASASRATILAAMKDIDGVRRSLQTAFVFTFCVIGCLLAIGLVLGESVDWARLLNLHTISRSEAGWVVVLLSAYLSTNLWSNSLDAWFRVADKAAIGAFLLANRGTLDVVVSILTLLAGGGVLTLAVALATTRIAMAVVVTLVAMNLSPWPILGCSNASKRELLVILKPAIAFLGFPLTQIMTIQGTVQVLNIVAGTSTVVAFTMARTLMRLCLQIGVVTNNAIKPELSRLIGSGREGEARAFSNRAAVIVTLLASVGFFLLIAVGPEIVQIWSGGVIIIPRGELALVGMHAVFYVAWIVRAAYLVAENKHVNLAATYAAGSALALLSWIILRAHISPIVGAALVLALPELLMVFLAFKQRALIANTAS